jgi:hypothetical protein
MILKRPGLSPEPFGGPGVIGATGDGHLGSRDTLEKEPPQPRHQACCVHIAVKTNFWESMTESFQLLTLTPEIIIIHEIYLPPTKDEALKVLYRFTEIFAAKYPESAEATVLPLTTPLIFIYPVTVYMSQGRNFILILNLILTMTYNFSMLKGRVNPMKMIDSAKPLLIMIKSIITIGREGFPHPAPHCCSQGGLAYTPC